MNKNVIHKAGGLYNIGMQRLISVDSYGDTFVIPEGVKFIGECAFWKCEELKSINIPNSVIDIGASAFAGCLSLKKIDIPDSVERICSNAFACCRSLEEITLPASLKFMSYCAFYGCNSLKKINYCNHSFIVDEILPGVIKANKVLCLNISDSNYLIPLEVDVILRSWHEHNYKGFFNIRTDYEILDSQESIYY